MAIMGLSLQAIAPYKLPNKAKWYTISTADYILERWEINKLRTRPFSHEYIDKLRKQRLNK
jgi:hypothetical protein